MEKVAHILQGLPQDWAVSECMENAATSGIEWALRLVDRQGQWCGAVMVDCSNEEIAAG